MGWYGADWSGSELEPVADSSEHSNNLWIQ